jgi:hypothetical protein
MYDRDSLTCCNAPYHYSNVVVSTNQDVVQCFNCGEVWDPVEYAALVTKLATEEDEEVSFYEHGLDELYPATSPTPAPTPPPTLPPTPALTLTIAAP